MSPAFVVLAALPEETEAILRCIEWKPLAPTSTVFGACYELDLGDPHDNVRRHGVLAQLAGTGRVSAAVSTVHAIHTWNPSLILIAGTAGGFQDRSVALGDVLVATKIVDYEAQRLDGDSTIRWADYEPEASLYALAKSIRLPATQGSNAQVRFGSILSGDKVLASKAAVEKFLGLRADVLGVEMEGAGVAFASAKSSVPCLMIRGIADYADDNKRNDSERWTKVACDSVARFVRALLERWADEAPAQTRAKR
ncbi:5'-methylthioadenosine/S-adenosylhomocysteine nucleosidase [Polyangium sp. 15x6]|uniref:5'-methylthioadenosine/S-adenosylhomocysteine nucleosidase family protein n=1 Tax=Polyangium sp. 15x6 TaxID=3042687 RepID=UPI00249B57A1|nr:5'-methylthioadenosine/S-adenosylhomocysteine nucleosidase [Polyangium sp. 15x6]MDI3291706.1 5'-methylthioadenosine/S-adenosylhomocysteine nucleosidase [Polyangium sp. 15x6]